MSISAANGIENCKVCFNCIFIDAKKSSAVIIENPHKNKGHIIKIRE